MKRLIYLLLAAIILPSLASASIVIYSDQPVSNSTTPQSYKYNQNYIYWAVSAVRSDPQTDWDIGLYSDSGCIQIVAGSSYIAGYVDFVVSDYNHSPTGWDGVRVNQYNGTGSCSVEYEDNTEMLTAPGNTGTLTWPADHIAHAWDVYLLAGTTYDFSLANISGSVDFGIALFQSNGAAYYAGRSSATKASDYSGPGEDETFSFTAPTTDYYGFILWANNAETGTFNVFIQTPPEIRSDHPLFITDSSQNRKFNQTNIYWAVGAVRSDISTDWDISLYADSNFTQFQAGSSYLAGTVDFVVSDYNHSPTGVHGLRANRFSGSDGCRFEYEDGVESIIPPQTTSVLTWPAGHVAHIWDVYMVSGTTWTFTVNNVSGSVDYGMALFNSNGAAYYAGRSSAQVLADDNGPGGSEIFTYTATATDYYGLVVWANNDEGGTFTIDARNDPVLISENPFYNIVNNRNFVYNQQNIYWAVTAVRPESGTDWDLYLYPDTLFGTPAAYSAYGGSYVDFVVGDYNHNPLGWQGARANRFAGTGNCQIEYVGTYNMLPSGQSTYTWLNGDHIVAVWDKYLSAGQVLHLNAAPSTDLDIGLALFKSNGATYFAGRSAADLLSDVNGVGGSEVITYLAPQDDFYGLVLWNNSAVGGTVTFDVATGVDEANTAIPRDYTLSQNYPNPFNAQTTISYSLPQQALVTIDIFDILGHKVNTISDGIQPAGYHQAIWDASNQASGMYFYKIKAGQFSETKKMMLVK
ncbi:MAG TPA: hypothetical protein DCZ43_08315 [candidate division Zixibacteria bacterium]|nr:hypothetical protein [candidate division Zixibacteria bacterium]